MGEPLTLGRRILAAATYLGGGAVQRGLQLLLLPLLVGTLSPEEFARYGLFASAIALLPVALTGNTHSAGPRLVFHHAPEAWAHLFRKSLRLALVPLAASLGAAWLLYGWLGADDRITLEELGAATAAIAGSVLLQHALAVARVVSKPGSFGIAVSIRALVTLGVYGSAVLLGSGGYHIAVWAVAFGYLSAGSAGLAILRKGGKSDVNQLSGSSEAEAATSAWGREIAAFSYPTAVNFFATWVMVQGGRWIGTARLGLAEVADYMLLMIVIGATGMITRAIFDAELPNYSRHFADKRWNQGLRSLLGAGAFSVVGVFSAIGLLVLLVHYDVLPSGYAIGAPLLIASLALSFVDVTYVAGMQILICTNRTKDQAAIGVIGGVLALSLTLALVGPMEELGLVLATTVGYLMVAGGTWWRAWQSR